jgi:hypothetical protein
MRFDSFPGGLMKSMILGLSLILFTISPAAALQPDAIGHIQTLKGAASIMRGNTTLPAAIGVLLYSGDTIRTAKTDSVGIVLTDDSTFSLGPNSEIVLKDYLFNPKEGKFSLVTRMAKGTFSYLSGIIGKLSPNSIHLELPEATIAVRGTKLFIKVDE